VNTVAECTLPEKILLAASALEEAGQSPFSAEALIVSAWHRYPTTFGLKGYAEQYPDSNKVLSSIMGEKGLTKKGWLSKVGQKLYTLTREGRQMVRHLRNEDEKPAPTSSSTDRIKLKAEEEGLLQELLASPAVEKVREGRKQELNFADGCRFWNINNGMSATTLDTRMGRVRDGLAELQNRIGRGNAVLRDGRSVSGEEVQLLIEINAFLEERFARHLTLLRNRTERV
jgi:hypothetical protein